MDKLKKMKKINFPDEKKDFDENYLKFEKLDKIFKKDITKVCKEISNTPYYNSVLENNIIENKKEEKKEKVEKKQKEEKRKKKKRRKIIY
jgi:hypothetical protein